MSQQSAIEWTEATLNPWTGCTRVSPGCAKCYISRTMPFRIAGRDFDRKGNIPLAFHMERLERMIRRRKPTLYFVNSLSDLFHEDATDAQIAVVFSAMANAPQHTFQILTKRPERMVRFVRRLAWTTDLQRMLRREGPARFRAYLLPDDHWSQEDEPATPLPNVWLGVSIENRRFVHRADLLRETPAAVRFISAEPLLGPLVIRGFPVTPADLDRRRLGWVPIWGDGYQGHTLDLTDIDWLIVGGESGPQHRPIRVEWVRDLRDAALANGTAFFMKQWGGRTPKSGGRDLDGRTWDEFPRALERSA